MVKVVEKVFLEEHERDHIAEIVQQALDDQSLTNEEKMHCIRERVVSYIESLVSCVRNPYCE